MNFLKRLLLKIIPLPNRIIPVVKIINVGKSSPGVISFPGVVTIGVGLEVGAFVIINFGGGVGVSPGLGVGVAVEAGGGGSEGVGGGFSVGVGEGRDVFRSKAKVHLEVAALIFSTEVK